MLSLMLGLVAPARAAQDAEAERLFATVKQKQEHAQKLRADASAKLQEANDEQVQAATEEREARVLTTIVLHRLKADGNKFRAAEFRHQAQLDWNDAHLKELEARNDQQKATQLRRDVEELTKAAAQVADQPTVAAGLQNDARTRAATAQQLEAAAQTAKTEAARLDVHATVAWEQAGKLDPEGQAQVAVKPIKPELRPTPPPR